MSNPGHEKGDPLAESGEITELPTGDVVIGAPPAVAIVITPDEEEE